MCGGFLYFSNRKRLGQIGNREGLAAVSLAWIVLTFFGALPLTIWDGTVNGSQIGLTEAYFETMSGFTTTGATIIEDIQALPHGLLFWRSFTHWLGGMGIVVLWVAILPALGPGSYQLFRSEMPGLSAERIRPRIGETAKILWGIYCLISLVELVLLWIGPMDLFNASCHTFGTLATGGFSTYNDSIAHFDSWYVDMVIIVFMFLAGCNFGLYYLVFTGRIKDVLRNTEIRFYCLVIVVSVLFLMVMLNWHGLQRPEYSTMSDKEAQVARDHFNEQNAKIETPKETFRVALFQAVSITTTTGYGTADFDMWPDSCRILLVMLMFFGGCAGSTGGGLKQIRIILIVKLGFRELRRAIQPNAVFPIKIGKSTLDESILSSVMGMFLLAIVIFAGSTLFMSILGLDIVSAATSVLASMFNIGPGLAKVGSIQNYAFIPAAGKWLLCACMLLGRLEFVCVMALFQPLLYRK